MNPKKTVLIIAYSKATFVLNDYSILSDKFKTELYLTGKLNKSLLYTGYRLFILFFKIVTEKYDLVYVWGLDFNSLIPAILKNVMNFKLVIVPLGYEVDRIKDIKYGNSNKFKEFITTYASKKADTVICTSEYASNKSKNMGIDCDFVYLCLNKDSKRF